jgi:hypothetical protein
MSAFDCFGLRGSSAPVKVTEWSPASTAKFIVYTVWVRVLGVPETLLDKEGCDEIGSMLGTVQDVDMAGYRENNLIRVLVGVRDPTKIPKVSQLTDYPFIYDIRFELEQIVEHGGPIVDGNIADGMRETGNYNGAAGMDEEVPSSQGGLEQQMERELRTKCYCSSSWF